MGKPCRSQSFFGLDDLLGPIDLLAKPRHIALQRLDPALPRHVGIGLRATALGTERVNMESTSNGRNRHGAPKRLKTLDLSCAETILESAIVGGESLRAGQSGAGPIVGSVQPVDLLERLNLRAAEGMPAWRDVLPLVAYGHIMGGPREGMPVVAKGGTAGDRDATETCARFLRDELVGKAAVRTPPGVSS